MYQKIFSEIIFPRYKPRINAYYKDYRGNLLRSREEISLIQLRKLRALLSHAKENVPYYRKQWFDKGFDPGDVNSILDLESLPILEKVDITENFDQISAQGDLSNTFIKATGGSTGDPFRFRVDYDSDEMRQAVMWRGYGWLGAVLGCHSLYLWGADVGEVRLDKKLKNALYHKLYNRKMLNSFKMEKANMGEYIDAINSYKPAALVSYVNPLVTLAKYILENQVKVHRPATILTGAEALYEYQREIIEKAFDSKVYNTYGSREFMLIAAECPRQNGLHVNTDHLVVETVDENDQAVRGQAGDLVITDLSNYGMPFIRYRNGDRAILSDRQCDCGNPLPLIEKIEGRKLDAIKTSTGLSIPGEFFPHLLKDLAGIDKFQVVQDSLNEISLSVVANAQWSGAEKEYIRTELDKYAKGALAISINLVDHIPLTSSGKHRVTVCNI